MNWRNPIILGALAGSGKFGFLETDDFEWGLTPALSVVLSERHRLVARPVSDMSDEEWSSLMEDGYANWNGREFVLFDKAGSYFKVFELGVLPETLADEDVIWKEKNVQ